MCGKGEKTVTQKTEIPPEVKAQYAYLMDRANQVAETPYQAYNGQRVAGLVPAQYEAMGMMRNAAMAGQNPNYWSSQGIQQYMSPYTQSVIDATLANTNQADQLQQQQIMSSAIRQGNAFGGDRMGVAQAELARNQGLARNQTISNLWNQNWNQANENFARQQQYGLQANDAASRLATQYLGAGSLSQANQQRELDALYEQYQNQLAYPYQQLGWLGNLSLGVGSSSGGTTTKTESGGSPFGQIFGGALSLMSMFPSDERAKENIREIGETHDGQPIYAYNYRGDERTQIGLIAQEVEQTHPEAVGRMPSGLLGVDYDLATRDAARAEYAAGGAIPGLGGAGGVGLIPELRLTAGGLRLPEISSSGQGSQRAEPNYRQMGQDAGRILGRIPGLLGAGQPTDIRPPAQIAAVPDPAANVPVLADAGGGGLETLSALGGMFAFGGPVGFGGAQWGASSPNSAGQNSATQGISFGGSRPMMGGWGGNPASAPAGTGGPSNGPAMPTTGDPSNGPASWPGAGFTGRMMDSANPRTRMFGQMGDMLGRIGMTTGSVLSGNGVGNYITGGPALGPQTQPPNTEGGITGGPMTPPVIPGQQRTTVGIDDLWNRQYSWLSNPMMQYDRSRWGTNPFAGASRPTWGRTEGVGISGAADSDGFYSAGQPGAAGGYASGGAVGEQEDLPAPNLGSLVLPAEGVGLLPGVVMPPREMLDRPAPRMELPPLPEGRVPPRPEPRAADATPPAPRSEGRGSASSFDIADRTQPAHWRALLRTIAGPESGGRYNVRFNGTPQGATFDDYSRHPNVLETIPEGQGFTQPGRRSSAAGAYQFTGSTWETLPEEIRRGGFTPENQDRAARWLATERYRQQTGRDLDADLQANGLTPGMVRTLGPTWEAFARGRPEDFVSRYSQLVGQPAGGGQDPASQLARLERDSSQPARRDGVEGGDARPATPARRDSLLQQILRPLGVEISDDARQGILAAGLGMMASRSRNPLTQIGEGGLGGLAAYRETIGMNRQNDLTRAQIADLQSHSRQREADTALKQRQLAMQERAESMFTQLFGGNFAPGAPPPTGPTPGAAPAPSADGSATTAGGGGAGNIQTSGGAAPASGTAPAGATPAPARDRGDEIDPSWSPPILAQAGRVAAARGMEGYAKAFNEQLQRIMQTGMVYNRRGELVPLPGYAEANARAAGQKRAEERQAENDLSPRVTDSGDTVTPSSRRGAPAAAPPPPAAAAPAQPSSAPPAPAPGAAATPVAPPAPAPLPAAARLSRAQIDPTSGRVQSVVPPSPNASGGYPPAQVEPGEYRASLGPLETKRRENDAAAEAEVSEKAMASSGVQQQLREIGQAFKLFGSNTITDRLMGGAQIAAALGQNDISQRLLRGARADAGQEARADAVAAAEWLEKNGNELALNLLKAANSRFTQAEFITFAQRGVPTRAMRPETAHNLLASQMGAMEANRRLQEDWLRARQQGWQSISAFADEWKRANPTSVFIDAASRQLGNFRGMPLPPIDRWVEGSTYVAPENLQGPQREALARRGVQPGQTFRYLGNGRLEIVRPEEAFTAHLRQ